MQNVRKTQIKRSIILSNEEFDIAVRKSTGKDITPQLDMDGIWFDYDEDKYDIENVDDYVKECLSNYFEINVTSIHIDDCDLTGVWIVFDKDLSPEKTKTFFEQSERDNDVIEEDVDLDL